MPCSQALKGVQILKGVHRARNENVRILWHAGASQANGTAAATTSCERKKSGCAGAICC